ncbi:hypothetical protein LTR50_006353 [Elasticomyces elasticus]|nr:hypothetical protein LTR50_006353 [Elasticomyces elasticus]
MRSQLWKYYLEDDVEAFRHVLETSAYSTRHNTQKGGGGGQIGGTSFVAGSPSGPATSPVLTIKGRKTSGFSPGIHALGTTATSLPLTRADVNGKDTSGMAILHYAASSTSTTALGFATALLHHPLTDLYVQDLENGWTALHRALYFGNITIAHAILDREARDAQDHRAGVVTQHAVGLVKIKDKEGNGPLDLYAATIKDRTLRPGVDRRRGSSASDDDDEHAVGDSGDYDEDERRKVTVPCNSIEGDELFTFGSNKNITLGLGNEDDRQFPERVALRRPDHLLQRFYREHVQMRNKQHATFDPSPFDLAGSSTVPAVSDLPWVVRAKPITIQDVHMSKLSTAVLTADPESNLYMCGHGPGGRLGTGNERTYFNFACIEGGALANKRVVAVALGQNHTLALSDGGDIFSWGSNAFGQLGYILPKATLGDEDPIQTLPRQIFGPLKKEPVIGIAASRIHSVAHTSNSLYTFGKNEGQLGIVDSDARSLEAQIIPRKVAASLFTSSIASVSAIDRATVCLLESHEVWVFANYGYARLTFPLEGFSNYFLKESFLVTKYDKMANHISKVTAGGDTICALSSNGEVYTVAISQRSDAQALNSSTTNPTKIRSALSQPHRVWSPKKANMAARDVGVDADGSIILATDEGSVWKRILRAKIKDTSALGTAEYKPKDFKFSRTPGLSRIVAVRASAYGAYAAVRRDCDVTKTQIVVEDQSLWRDIFPMLSFSGAVQVADTGDIEDSDTSPRFWRASHSPSQLQLLRRHILQHRDIEDALKDYFDHNSQVQGQGYDALLCSTVSELRIPVHWFILASRSRVLRQASQDGFPAISDMLSFEVNKAGTILVTLHGLDILTLVNLALYVYTDTVVDFWHFTKEDPTMAFRYRQIRTELIKIASKLEIPRLESAAKQMVEAKPGLDVDLELALRDPAFLEDGDTIIQLADADVKAYSVLLRRRCPFFEGMFEGRAGGLWLHERRAQSDQPSDAVKIDLKHIQSSTFRIVLRHLYADTGEELFDAVVSSDLDEFLDLVLDVMSVANELMLDRLSQICQHIAGRYGEQLVLMSQELRLTISVNVRNACSLLNAIAPSSVTEFRDATLEYLCLSLEAALQSGLLDELDEELRLELDQVVRENQLACLPFAKSGRAEALLHERHPELAGMIDRHRQAKIDSIVLHAKYSEADALTSTSFKAYSWDETSSSPLQVKTRRRPSKDARVAVERPSLKDKASARDLMFDMDEESTTVPLEQQEPASNREKPHLENEQSLDSVEVGPHQAHRPQRGHAPEIGHEPFDASDTRTTDSSSMRDTLQTTAGSISQPWSAAPLGGTTSDMKEIMAQASKGRVSNISLGLAARSERSVQTQAGGSFHARMSQKDRKKMQQEQQTTGHGPVQVPDKPSNPQPASPKVASPWQIASARKVASLKDVLHEKKSSALPVAAASPQPEPVAPRSATTPQLTMRQTIANPKVSPSQKPVIGPASQHSMPPRSVSGPVKPPVSLTAAQVEDRRPSASPQQGRQHSIAAALAPKSPPNLSSDAAFPSIQSVRHQPRPVEPSLQLSMSDILSQQQAEKDVIKEAAAARSLQDIQAEQEFQAWWDKESAKAMEEEERKNSPASRGGRKARVRGGGPTRGGVPHRAANFVSGRGERGDGADSRTLRPRGRGAGTAS